MTGPVRRLLAEGRDQRSRLMLATVLGALATGSAIALMATSAWLISRAAQHPPVLTLMVAVVGVRAFAVGRGVFRYAERLVSHDASLRVLTALRIKVFAALEPLAPVSWMGARRGDLLTRLVGDVDTVLDLFVRVVLPIGAAAVVSVFAVALVGWLLPVAGVALAVTLFVGGVIVPGVAARTGRRAAQLTAEARGDLTNEVVDALTGSAELVAFGAADDHLARVAAADTRLAALERSTAASTALAAGLGALAAGAGVWAALALGVPAVRGGSLQGVLLAVVVLTALAAPEAVAGLPGAADHLERVRRGAQRLFAVVDTPAPVPEPRTPVSVPPGPVHVRLSGVSARYGANGPLALRDVDLDLPPGQRVAVVGMSGAGKSTLINVLLRFLEVEAGTFTINGVDVREMAADDVRRVIGSCEQEPHLFDTSIRNNLLVAAPQATDDELISALRRARIADWVSALPDGLDTLVGENGAAVSGGQLRRIALARALLADFPVLLLDEPTEGLPGDVADELVADLMEATKDRTVLLVTHRRQQLEGLGQIVELHSGRVVARS